MIGILKEAEAGLKRAEPCRYESRRRVDDEALTGRMMAIAAQKRRYGYRRMHVLAARSTRPTPIKPPP
ncbi:hypothetical protein WJ08_08745 [Burkholderia vietnamiensis]|nr:hypothetical protein WJ08_08745 [Burkholderia vietnamiensis]KVF47337.1 hypothetical protein WJ10_03390 [Burkholderia vietnamiensis]